ncbi:uncharacterized protein [Venturia canescens]|uniref:uncharacterized protein n=1 Tax=Venturia canescens TaxID=32260 RepID=UPI001C9D02BE|nr:uncharacterized protein LOC122419142 [Venturia canescens]
MEKITSSLMKAYEKQVWREIIEDYRKMPHLWNPSHADYRNPYNRNRSMETLLRKYKRIDPDVNMQSFKKKIENLRTARNRELKKVEASMQSDSVGKDVYVPTLWYFDLLSFLNEKNEHSLQCADSCESFEEENSKASVLIEPPPAKKQRTQHPKAAKASVETDEKINNADQSEWEVIGKSIGYQLKGLERTQLTIAQKLISDVIFYGKMNRLLPDSCITVSPSPSSHTSASSNTFGPTSFTGSVKSTSFKIISQPKSTSMQSSSDVK